jgi:hypothetical protein
MKEPDAGKWNWPVLLTKIFQHKTDSAQLLHFVREEGKKLQEGRYTGSFFKPFTNTGYTQFFFEYLPYLTGHQKEMLRNALYGKDSNGDTGWNYLMRKDHHMDPIYSCTEFNSENFEWKMRTTGFLFARYFNDKDKMRYWVRALFNAGRIEWESNIYFGYCFAPAMVMRQYAPDDKSRKQAQVVMDWMLLDAAIHYLDGVQTGPDIRAKPHQYKAFAGSAWFWTYLYFADSATHPSFAAEKAFQHAPPQMLGYALHSDYRPLQVAIDIAQRKFATPVEMHNARPFYALDNNNYSDWKGNTYNSRRFDFETHYLEQNYTLGSTATNRPDSRAAMATKKGFYSEQSVWRLAVKGRDNGAVQIFGNAGSDDDDAGRWPYEEIGQHRNVVVPMIKHTDNMWTVIPRSARVVQNNNQLFADLGNDVFIALTPFNEQVMKKQLYNHDTSYQRCQWIFDTAAIGALALEVGTAKEDGSFEQFVIRAKTKSGMSLIRSNTIRYTSRQQNILTMEYVERGAYKLADGTIWKPAGSPPRLWTNGTFINYGRWNAFEVVSGEKILSQRGVKAS